MSDVGPPPTKRARYALRVIQPRQTRYLLRSRVENEGIVIESPAWPEPKRKRRLRIAKLMDLNNDCLLEILRHTDVKTMCHVADTCDRFQGLARYHFRIKYSQFNFASFIDGPTPLRAVSHLLQNFGDLITSLSMTGNIFPQSKNHSNFLLDLVNRNNCPLKELTLEDFNLLNGSSKALKSILKPIENLTLDSCSLKTLNGLGIMQELKKLKIRNVDCIWSDILTGKFAKLEQLELENLDDLMTETLVPFIYFNQSLKRLSIIKCDQVSSTVFGVVGKLDQLEEFEFQPNEFIPELAFQNDMVFLSSLKQLKTFKLNCLNSPVSKLLADFFEHRIAIEHLELANGPMDDATFKNIKNLKTVKILKLNEMTELVPDQILGFGKELKQLEQFHVKTRANITQYSIKRMLAEANQLSCLKIDAPNFTVNQNTYQEMLHIIQKREKFVKLELTIYGDNQQLAVPGEQNDKRFIVKQLNRQHNHIFPHRGTPEAMFDIDSDDGIDFSDDEDEIGMELPDDDEMSEIDEVPSPYYETSDSDASTDYHY